MKKSLLLKTAIASMVVGASVGLVVPCVADNNNTEQVIVSTSGSNLNIRVDAGSNYKIVGKLPNNTKLTVSSTKKDGKGCGNGWAKIARGTYLNRWVCSDYLTSNSSTSETAKTPNTKTQAKSYIDVRKMSYTTYKSNIKLKFYNRTKSAQNFTIANLHSQYETFYFSTVNVSYVDKAEKDSSKIYETYILKVKSSDLSNTSKGQTMSIPYAGHGQMLQLGANGNTIWTNSDAGSSKYPGTPYKYYNGKYWGSKNYGISEYAFGNSNGSKKQRLYLGDAYQYGLKGSIDFYNSKMAIVSGRTAYIVNFANSTKTHKSYSSKISLVRKYNGSTLNSQGYALYNGHFYEYLNDSSSNLYIACYNLKGERIYIKKMNLGANMEAEGMQIIDGELFIGIKDTKNKTFTIGTFK